MKNLITRKLVFGMLMACVLALGVQGNADALTFTDPPNNGDLGVVGIRQPFSVTFRASVKSPTNILNTSGHRVHQTSATERIDASGYVLVTITGTTTTYRASTDAATKSGFRAPVTGETGRQAATGAHVDNSGNVVDSEGRPVYVLVAGGPRLKAAPNDPVPVTDRFHYDEEAIAISVTPATMTFKRSVTTIPVVGSPVRITEALDDTTASLWEEHETSNRRPASSITLTGEATAAGVYTITITDVTPAADFRTAPTSLDSITFTVTVLQAVATSRDLTIISVLSDTIVGEFGTESLSVTVSDTTENARVEFEITRGPGSLSAEKTVGSKTSRRLSTLTGTGGVATVNLDPKRGTNHVRAWIYGNPPGTTGKSTEAIYIYRWAILNKVSGDSGDSGNPQQNQRGTVSSRLEEPFVVQLFDSTGRTTIPGAEITFKVVDSGGTDVSAVDGSEGNLTHDPSTPSNLRVSPTAAETTANPTVKKVKTDSNGRASIFLVLGATASADYRVTAAHTESDTKTFTATSLASTVTPKAQSITKVPNTDGQRANQYGVLEKALIVVVRDQYGNLLRSTVVEFDERDGGTLSPPDSTKGDPGSQSTATGADDSDRRRDIITDDSGMASVRYSAADKVRAAASHRDA